MFGRYAVPIAALSLFVAACDSGSTVSAPASQKPSAVASSAAASAELGDYDEKADAGDDIKKALAASAKDGKPVLVDFGADWCPDCVVLGKLGTKPTVAPLLGRYHVVSVDVGEFDKNLDVADDLTLDLKTSGIPALVVLDAKGRVRTATNDGSFANARSMSAGEFAAFLGKWM